MLYHSYYAHTTTALLFFFNVVIVVSPVGEEEKRLFAASSSSSKFKGFPFVITKSSRPLPTYTSFVGSHSSSSSSHNCKFRSQEELPSLVAFLTPLLPRLPLLLLPGCFHFSPGVVGEGEACAVPGPAIMEG